MHWITRDATQFSLDLTTAMFTKEEMQGHLAFITAAGKKERQRQLYQGTRYVAQSFITP